MRVADVLGAPSGFEAFVKVVEVGLYLGLISCPINVSTRLNRPLMRPRPWRCASCPFVEGHEDEVEHEGRGFLGVGKRELLVLSYPITSPRSSIRCP